MKRKTLNKKNNTIIFPIEEVDNRMKSQTLNIMKKIFLYISKVKQILVLRACNFQVKYILLVYLKFQVKKIR